MKRLASLIVLAVGLALVAALVLPGGIDPASFRPPEAPAELHLEPLEARPWGRLIEYDPATNRARVLLDDLYFANGVAVSEDGSFVLVAETFRYRIRRYWLTGPRAGEDEVFADNLPGFPDGVSGDGRGQPPRSGRQALPVRDLGGGARRQPVSGVHRGGCHRSLPRRGDPLHHPDRWVVSTG